MGEPRNFQLVDRVIRLIGNIIGINFLDKQAVWNSRIAYPIGVIIYVNLSIIYTLHYYKNNLIMLLKCMPVAPQAIQCSLKFWYLMKHRALLHSAFGFLQKVYSVNTHAGPRRAKALTSCAQHYGIFIRLGVPLIVCIAALVCAPPVYSYFVLNKKELFVELLVPGLPPVTHAKFVATLVLQFVMLLSGFVLTNLCDFVIFTLFVHVSMLADIFLVALEELNPLVLERTGLERRTRLVFHLKKCFQMHQDLSEYISMLNTFVSKQALFYLATVSLALSVSCYCIVKTDWIGAYAYGIFAFIEVLLASILGTFVEVINDRIVDAIYDTPWHLLPTDCQKMVCLLLLKSQNARKITIANAANLNVATGSSIIKIIYSYTMILLNFGD